MGLEFLVMTVKEARIPFGTANSSVSGYESFKAKKGKRVAVIFMAGVDDAIGAAMPDPVAWLKAKGWTPPAEVAGPPENEPKEAAK